MFTADQIPQKLKTFATTITKMRNQAHELAVSCINHAYEHGDCIYLNQFNKVLTSGMQASLKRYVVATCADDPTDRLSSWLTVKAGEYVINTDIEAKDRNVYFRSKEAGEVRLNDPSELEQYASFLDIDPDKVKNPFADNDVLKRVDGIVRNAEADDSQTSEQVRQYMKKVQDDLKNMVKAA